MRAFTVRHHHALRRHLTFQLLSQVTVVITVARLATVTAKHVMFYECFFSWFLFLARFRRRAKDFRETFSITMCLCPQQILYLCFIVPGTCVFDQDADDFFLLFLIFSAESTLLFHAHRGILLIIGDHSALFQAK